MAMLEINHLQKKFGTTEVLRDVSFTLGDGEFLSVIGPSARATSWRFWDRAGRARRRCCAA